MLFDTRHQWFVHAGVGAGHCFGVGQRGFLAFVEEWRAFELVERGELLLADAAFQAGRGVDVDAERAPVDLRDAYGEQRTQAGVDRRTSAIQRAIE